MADYPVYTRKARPTSPTSPAPGRCSAPDAIYPAVRDAQRRTRRRRSSSWPATAPSSSSSACTAWAKRSTTTLRRRQARPSPCRIYAPVGSTTTLLAYLVRRLLENGANTSFVHRIADRRSARGAGRRPAGAACPIADAPASAHSAAARALSGARAIARRRPRAPRRARATRGADAAPIAMLARPSLRPRSAQSVREPANLARRRRQLAADDAGRCRAALDRATAAFEPWSTRPRRERAAILERAADLLEAQHARAGIARRARSRQDLGDAVAEVREAVDFCRYYARRRAAGLPLRCAAGPAGERNQLACTAAASSRASARGIFRSRSSSARSRRRSPPAMRSSRSRPSRRR